MATPFSRSRILGDAGGSHKMADDKLNAVPSHIMIDLRFIDYRYIRGLADAVIQFPRAAECDRIYRKTLCCGLEAELIRVCVPSPDHRTDAALQQVLFCPEKAGMLKVHMLLGKHRFFISLAEGL